MISAANVLREAVVEYCSKIGADPMLAQGAGGNVSWKEGGVLWIKASGTWLSEASQKDIFLPVDLFHISTALKSGEFFVAPKLQIESLLRPSIETTLHALMPHLIVVHLHAVEILATLVRPDFEVYVKSRLDKKIIWVTVPYTKPGPALAKEVSLALKNVDDPNVIFLKNHGVVIGASTVEEVEYILSVLVDELKLPPQNFLHEINGSIPESFVLEDGFQFIPISDPVIHQLAINEVLFERLLKNWALYPDHVVFLGAQPYCYSNFNILLEECRGANAPPELIFLKHVGVFVTRSISMAKQAQLRCYYDVLIRQPENCALDVLNNQEIAELLDWNAEKYRMRISK